MSIKVLYFASLKEGLGLSGESVELAPGVQTIGDLRDWLIAQGRDKLGSAKNLRCAVNQELARLDTTVKEGDEVAFFPPVTGG